jgi:regulatory protein
VTTDPATTAGPPSRKPPAASCLDKAVELLSRRSHFTRQLERKLRQRGYPPAEVAAALARVTELGYLDDRRTARQYVESRLARGAEGARRIRAALQRQGAPAEVIEEAMAVLPRDDVAAAREAAAGWRRRQRATPDPRSLARHLERKGFSHSSIYTLVDELRSELGDS